MRSQIFFLHSFFVGNTLKSPEKYCIIYIISFDCHVWRNFGKGAVENG